jgi:hypothetical protein
LLNTSTSFLPIPSRDGLSVNKYGSDEYVINHLYSSDSPTWSDIESSYGSSGGSHDEIKDSFTVLAGLAFLEGDAIAEKEADQFFSRVQVKTRKIMVTKKA